MKQTAIQWLVYELSKYVIHRPIGLAEWEILKELAELAKEMERQQHGDTWDEAIETHERRGHVIARSYCDFDDYYNETYKK